MSECTDGELMTPAGVLHWLDRLGIRYMLNKGHFVTDTSIMLQDGKQCLPNLKRSIEAHADALAALLPTYDPQICHWCHLKIGHGKFFVRVYAQEEGRRYTFHQECYIDRRELHPNLPAAETFLEEPGYTVVIEDSGLCAMCNITEAQLPEEAPNLCLRCWRKQNAKKSSRTSSGAA